MLCPEIVLQSLANFSTDLSLTESHGAEVDVNRGYIGLLVHKGYFSYSI